MFSRLLVNTYQIQSQFVVKQAEENITSTLQCRHHKEPRTQLKVQVSVSR